MRRNELGYLFPNKPVTRTPALIFGNYRSFMRQTWNPMMPFARFGSPLTPNGYP
jgi:hypothetical protein